MSAVELKSPVLGGQSHPLHRGGSYVGQRVFNSRERRLMSKSLDSLNNPGAV